VHRGGAEVDGRLNQASNKLEDGWALLRILESARDALAFKAVYAALFVACRSIPDAIDRELKPMLRKDRKTPEGSRRLSDYGDWCKAKLKERQEPGSLLEFVENARDADVHEGKHQLQFPGVHIGLGMISPANGPPGTSSVVINPDGAYYLVDMNTPIQRRVPILDGITSTIQVSLATPLMHHRGEALAESDPIAVARTALNYYAELLWEAKENFLAEVPS
jgi:hypothetical protein